MSFNSTLANLETSENLEVILNLLTDIAPGNKAVQREVEKISKSTQTQIRQLTVTWESRRRPLWSEIALREENARYAAEIGNEIIKQALALPLCNVESRSFIIKSSTVWRGFMLEISSYLPDPLIFEGEINFVKIFEPLVIVDRESQAVNLIWSIQKIIRKGEEMGLSDHLWIQLFLTFVKSYLPTAFQAVSRYSDNLDCLFNTLVANVNSAHEISKLRLSLSKLSRRPQEMIQPSLFRVRALYEMILQISYPSMSEDEIMLQSDGYAGQASKSLVSSNTAELIDKYITYNIQKGRSNTIIALADLITKHETSVPADKISTQKFLPDDKTKLDLQTFQAHSVAELMITSAHFGQSHDGKRDARQYSRSNSRDQSKGHGRFRSTSRGRPSHSHSVPNRNRSNSAHSGRHSSRPHQNIRTSSRDRFPRHSSGQRYGQHSSRDRRPGRSSERSSQGGSSHRPRSATPSSRGPTSSGRSHRPRSQTPRPSRISCVRCGEEHSSGNCAKYVYWSGPPCSICNRMHATKSHRDRSASVNRQQSNRDSNNRSAYHVPDHKYRDSAAYQTEIEAVTRQNQPETFNIFKPPKNQ